MSRLAPGLRIYRGNLPHWRLLGATYFVTWRIHPQRPDLNESERSAVARSILKFHGSKYRLHAYVVMNDHVHALLTPSTGLELEQALRSWKSFTSQKGREPHGSVPLWQREYFDRIVRDEAEFVEKQQYIRNNPWKRWPELESYAWVGVESEFDGDGGSGDPPPPEIPSPGSTT